MWKRKERTFGRSGLCVGWKILSDRLSQTAIRCRLDSRREVIVVAVVEQRIVVGAIAVDDDAPPARHRLEQPHPVEPTARLQRRRPFEDEDEGIDARQALRMAECERCWAGRKTSPRGPSRPLRARSHVRSSMLPALWPAPVDEGDFHRVKPCSLA